jgi:regulatory protein
VRAAKRPRKLASEELFEYAVACLGRRGFSVDELRARLRMRAAAVSDVDTSISRLKEIGYLDDKRFAESYALNRAENDGFGRRRVLSDLRARRVSPAVAESVVSHVFEDRNEAEQIEAFIDRRMPSLRAGGKIEDERQLARAWRRLRHAGFSSGASLTALKKLAARPEAIEEPADEDEERNPEG